MLLTNSGQLTNSDQLTNSGYLTNSSFRGQYCQQQFGQFAERDGVD